MLICSFGESIGGWALILAGIFSLFALLTTFWSNTLALRDVVHEQVGTGNRVSWLIATVPCILFAIFGVSSFIVLTRIMSGVVVLVSIMLVLTYGKSRKKVGSSPICGIFGTVPFQVLMMVSTIVSAVGAMLPLKRKLRNRISSGFTNEVLNQCHLATIIDVWVKSPQL